MIEGGYAVTSKAIRPDDGSVRSLWLTNTDLGVRQALKESVFRREQVRRKEAVTRRVETLHVIINQAWHEEVGATLIGLEWLKSALGENRESSGELPHMHAPR